MADVTPEWLGGVLDVDVRRVDVLEAHSGTTGRVKVRVDSAGAVPDTLFLKLRPFDEEQAEFLDLIGLGVSEAQLYAAVGDQLPVRVPEVWHSGYDVATGAFVIVLEDLDASGCRLAAADEPEVVAIAESLMDELAALHAQYWGQELEWLGTHALSPGEGPEAEERMAMGAAIVHSAVDQFAADLPPEFAATAQLYVDRTSDIAALWGEGEPTLIHGDDHIGNLFLDTGRVGFYDWAVASRYPGMRDVAYFLCNSLPTSVRRAEEDGLIRRYRARLAALGIDLDATTAEQQYRLFSVYSWVSATTTCAMGSKWQPADVGWEATRRTTQALADLDVIGLLRDRLRDAGSGRGIA